MPLYRFPHLLILAAGKATRNKCFNGGSRYGPVFVYLREYALHILGRLHVPVAMVHAPYYVEKFFQ